MEENLTKIQIGDKAVLDSKFLECQSVAVRNVFRCACVMFRWPVADMTGHDSQVCCVYIVYGRKLYCTATICKRKINGFEVIPFLLFVLISALIGVQKEAHS